MKTPKTTVRLSPRLRSESKVQLYNVDATTNLVSPRVGEILDETEVQNLIDAGTTVEISQRK
jgi:hypothetical protein